MECVSSYLPQVAVITQLIRHTISQTGSHDDFRDGGENIQSELRVKHIQAFKKSNVIFFSFFLKLDVRHFPGANLSPHKTLKKSLGKTCVLLFL